MSEGRSQALCISRGTTLEKLNNPFHHLWATVGKQFLERYIIAGDMLGNTRCYTE